MSNPCPPAIPPAVACHDAGVVQLVPVQQGADVERWLAVRNAVAPELALTLDEAVHSRRVHRDRIQLIALVDGRLAGALDARPWPAHPDLPTLGCEIFVLPAERGRGVGGALYRAASRWAGARGATSLDAIAFEADPAGPAYARRHGYEVLQRFATVELTLASAPALVMPPPAGIELTTLARRPLLDRELHALVVEVLADMPGEAPPALPYEIFHRHVLAAPGFRAEAAVLALAGERLAGFAYLDVSSARPGVGRHALTGVARPWRRLGLAGALKAAQIRWARTAGLELLVAENERRNEPIRRLNERLGYRRRPDWLVLRGPLAV